ncbi:MAG: BlaI/MecI/CopY family transcriptional regulator [Planctomycetaceae bacterium]
MVRRSALSKGELEVARVLWSLGKATVRDVFEAFSKKQRPAFATVQTYLRRLEAKGYLQTTLEGRVKVYSPRVRPKQVIHETVDDFMNRLFDGEALPLMRHLINERGISPEEIEQLRDMLNRLERENNESRQ